MLPSDKSSVSEKESTGFDVSSLEGLDISDEDIQDAVEKEGFDSVGSVSMPDDVAYIEFETDDLIKRLAPFLQKKAVSRDIITRSLKVVHDPGTPGKVYFFGTDGTSYLATAISAKVNNFPSEVILDTETFGIIVKTHKSRSYLISREKGLFSNFCGGELFIPSYSIQSSVFNRDFGKELRSEKIEGSQLAESLNALTPILVASEVPDLNYIFSGEDGVYACNGVIVGRVDYKIPELTIRHADTKIVSPLISATEGEQMYIKEFDNFYSVETDTFSYAFPKIQDKLDANYKAMVKERRDKFFVNLPYLTSILSVLDRMPEASGVIELEFGEVLRGISKTRKADVSSFQISSSKEGDISEGVVGVSNKALQVALRVFKGLSSISMSIKDEVISFSSEGSNGVRNCSIVLKR